MPPDIADCWLFPLTQVAAGFDAVDAVVVVVVVVVSVGTADVPALLLVIEVTGVN